MKRIAGVIGAMMLFSLLAAMLPAEAGLDIALGTHVKIGDDTDLFLNISSRYFNRDSGVVADLGLRYGNPDDLSVALFLSNRTRRDPGEIWRLRKRGLTWFEIGARFGVPADAWFIPVRRRPGPPFGNAYGHYKNGKIGGYRLSDVEARNLVSVRMIHEYYGVPVEVAMEWRASGKSIRTLMTQEYRSRHGKVATEKRNGKSGKGHGRKK